MTSLPDHLHSITGYGTAARIPDDRLVTVKAKEINEIAAVADQLLKACREVHRRLRVPPTNEGTIVLNQLVEAICKAEGFRP